MQLNFTKRTIRFMFMPISLLASVMIFNHSPAISEIVGLCAHRNTCQAYCTKDNYPMLPCQGRQYQLEYKGNLYTDFFVYPNPDVFHNPTGVNSAQDVETNFNDCQALIKKNPFHQMSEREPER